MCNNSRGLVKQSMDDELYILSRIDLPAALDTLDDRIIGALSIRRREGVAARRLTALVAFVSLGIGIVAGSETPQSVVAASPLSPFGPPSALTPSVWRDEQYGDPCAVCCSAALCSNAYAVIAMRPSTHSSIAFTRAAIRFSRRWRGGRCKSEPMPTVLLCAAAMRSSPSGLATSGATARFTTPGIICRCWPASPERCGTALPSRIGVCRQHRRTCVASLAMTTDTRAIARRTGGPNGGCHRPGKCVTIAAGPASAH